MNSEQFYGKRIIFPLLFIALCIAGNLTSSVFLYTAFIVAIFEVMMNPMEDAFCFSFFLIPNIRILDNTGITFLVNILIVLPVIRLLFHRKMKLPREALTGALLFLFIEGAHIVALGNFDSVASEACWLLAYVLCASVLLNNELVIRKRRVLDYLVGGIFLSAFAFLMCNISYTMNIVERVIDGSRFEAYADDPNFYSLYICLAMAILLSCRKKTKIDYIVFGLLSIIGVLTASKMCVLLMGFVVLATIIIQIVSKDTEFRNHSFMFKAVSVLFVLLMIFRDLVARFFSNLLKRAGFTAGSTSIDWAHITSRRSVITKNYFEILGINISALLWGYGFQYSEYLGESTGHGAHNTYLDFVLAWGIFGSAVLFYFMVHLLHRCLIKNIGKSKIGAIEWLPIITLLINFLDLSCLNATMFWFVVSAAYISLA